MLGIVAIEITIYSISHLVFIGLITKRWYSLQPRPNQNRSTFLLGQRESFHSYLWSKILKTPYQFGV